MQEHKEAIECLENQIIFITGYGKEKEIASLQFTIKHLKTIELLAEGKVEASSNHDYGTHFNCGGRRIDYVIGNELDGKNIKIWLEECEG